MLLLCGIGAKRQGWYRQLPVLGRRFRTLALDYRDVGDSDPATEPYSIDELADDVAALARELGIESASLVGDLHGRVHLARARPAPSGTRRQAHPRRHIGRRGDARIDLAGSDARADAGRRRSSSQAMAPGGSARSSPHPASRRAIRRRSTSSWRSRSTTRCDATPTFASSRPAGRTTWPTGSGRSTRRRSSCTGTSTRLFAIENGRLLAERIPGARLIVYENVGHIPEVECADDFNRDLAASYSDHHLGRRGRQVLAGDLTAALGYRTPAGGVVVQAVAPIGLRDREAGTVGFTTSLGFSKKLERIERDPRVAMAFHAREHGRCDSASTSFCRDAPASWPSPPRSSARRCARRPRRISDPHARAGSGTAGCGSTTRSGCRSMSRSTGS